MTLSILSHLRTFFFVCGAETWECVIMAAVVQQNELVFEFASNVMEDEQQVMRQCKKAYLYKLVLRIL